MRRRASVLQTVYFAQMEKRRHARLKPVGPSVTPAPTLAPTTGLISATPLSHPLTEVGELLAAAFSRAPREESSR